MNFDEYQRRASATDQNPTPSSQPEREESELRRHEVIPLLGLVGEVGGLLSEYKKLLRDGATHRRFRDEVAEELGDILWYVSNVANKFDLKLSEIVSANLTKVEDRWRKPERTKALRDETYAENQKLPRRFEYDFQHRDIGGRTKLVLIDRLNGGTAGNPLTDNAYEDDGYRYHDVLHLSFAACLGWSPVWRKLLRTEKRITNRAPQEVDDAEDGGRAQVIEEGIVLCAYVYADSHDFMQGTKSVDWYLLQLVKQFTAKLEVRDVTAWEWNDAILKGFSVWHQLRTHNGGVVCGDLVTGTIEFIEKR